MVLCDAESHFTPSPSPSVVSLICLSVLSPQKAKLRLRTLSQNFPNKPDPCKREHDSDCQRSSKRSRLNNLPADGSTGNVLYSAYT